MRYLLLVLLVVISLPCYQAQAGSASDYSTALEAEATGEESFGEWLNSKLVPSHTCPYCKQTFSEDNSMIMLIIGFVGQALFTSRFIVQWIASEQRKASYIPIAFWYLSIVGSLMLLAYAISILAWPIILGQCFGVVVYGRNLVLIFRSKNHALHEMKNIDSQGGMDSERKDSEK